MIIAALTGGIATGKSTVAAILKKAGAFIVDADHIARQVVAPGLPAWDEIRRCFGDPILTPDGSIDRPALGKIVFNDPDLRRRLESIVHPHVGEQIDFQIRQIAENSPDAVVIMDIPLLFETGNIHGFSDIIVVYAPEQIQFERLVARDGLSPQEARARMASQMPMSEKIKKAGIVIDNSGTLAETQRQTLAAYTRLTTRAGR
jgi:dephospho-CoA kinase